MRFRNLSEFQTEVRGMRDLVPVSKRSITFKDFQNFWHVGDSWDECLKHSVLRGTVIRNGGDSALIVSQHARFEGGRIYCDYGILKVTTDGEWGKRVYILTVPEVLEGWAAKESAKCATS